MGITIKCYVGAPGNRGASVFPEGRTYSPPRWGGGISYGNRALSEGDAAAAAALWTMPHFCGIAVIVHAVGSRCFHPRIPSLFATVFSQLPVKNIRLMFFTAMGIAMATPIFFLQKRNKNKSERTVRTNGNLPLGSESCKPRWWAKCCGSFRLSELLQDFERL